MRSDKLTLIVRLLMQATCLSIITIAMIMYVSAEDDAPYFKASLSPSPSPVSVSSRSSAEFQQGKQALMQSKNQQEGEEQNTIEEDYVIWNPTPYFGGGDAAPIPHAKVACFGSPCATQLAI